ncbi:MAG: GntR family transcriptional regulator [Thermoleophilia bacterium]
MRGSESGVGRQGGGGRYSGPGRHLPAGVPVDDGPAPRETAGPKIPAYLRIEATLSDRIARGDYRSGEQLPSESQLCREFGVSPMTLRRALAMLADRGLVAAEQGRGTFVRALELGEASFKLRQLTDQWQEDAVNVRLLAASTVGASVRVAETLGIPPGSRTVFLRRLLLKDGVPMMYHTEHVVFDARRPLVESQLQITSLEGLLQAAGSEGFSEGELTVRAVNLDATEATLLQQPEGAAAFCLEHVFHDFSGRPMSWGWFLCRADVFFLRTHLGSAAASRGAVA